MKGATSLGGLSDDVIKQVVAAETARKADGKVSSSSTMEKQIAEQIVGACACACFWHGCIMLCLPLPCTLHLP